VLLLKHNNGRKTWTWIQEEEVGEEYGERHTINTGSRIDGRVYAVDPRMEATVVDYFKHGEGFGTRLHNLYREAIERVGDHEEANNLEIAKSVFHTVNDHFEYNKDYADDISDQYPVNESDQRISLQGFYVQEGKGVCRHMALTTAVILEKMHEFGVIDGTGIVNQNADKEGGHMWAEYVEKDPDRRYILDIAQDHHGGPQNSNSTWDYHPEMKLDELGVELLE